MGVSKSKSAGKKNVNTVNKLQKYINSIKRAERNKPSGFSFMENDTSLGIELDAINQIIVFNFYGLAEDSDVAELVGQGAVSIDAAGPMYEWLKSIMEK